MSFFSISENTYGKPTLQLEIENEVVGWVVIKNDTLEHIAVNPNHRRKGHARKLLIETMEWMKQTKKRVLYFYNANDDFWNQMKKEFPRNVILYRNGECQIIAR